MATIHEVAARALLDGILLDPGAAADYAAFRAGLADAPEDAVHRFEDFGQLFHARHPGKWPLEQSAALYEFCIGLSAGERARLEIAVSGTPGADRERQANAETLRSLPAPFTAQVDMLQNGADCDGWFTWNTSIVLRSDPREGPRQAYLVEPHSVPLEIGYCMPSRALLHIRQARGVARWAYGSAHITLFYDLRGVPMADPRDPDQAWFWTDEWQEKEREADEDITAGRVRHFDSDEAFLAALSDADGAECDGKVQP